LLPAVTVIAPAGTTTRAAHLASAAWPYRDLDVARLLAGGWSPIPIRDVIVKVHQRCNLACDYCYVYTQADQSWRDRPAAMSAEVFTAAMDRVGRHVRRHDLAHVRVILHGGEPLLLGGRRLGQLADEARAALPSTCAVEVGVQTNGVLLTASALRQLRQHRIMVGVSVDGTAADHDRHRVTRAGRGTFAAVSQALDLLARPEFRDSYAGVLCTVVPEQDPVACYEQLRAFDPPMVDLLLPHANWHSPPRRPSTSPTPYGDWLVAVFDRWYSAPGPRVGLFESAIDLVLGGASRSEQLGLSPAALVVVESDGSIEQVDVLKSAYPGACATGRHVQQDDLDAVLTDPGVVARQIGRAALAEECLACPVHLICGAGHYAHRYRPGAGFRNPSVYCADLRRFVEHVRDRVTADLPTLVGAAAL
jgi:uncharacterized protein